jgi:pilus assembly protein Flp/PilA
MRKLLQSLLEATHDRRPERGASAVEYGLLIAGIAGLIVLAVFALGPIVEEAFADTCDSIKAEAGASMAADCGS